jgi:hypothetical protein
MVMPNQQVSTYHHPSPSFQVKLKFASLLCDFHQLMGLQCTWIMRFHELKPEDIHAPGKEDNEQEGNCFISWIWLTGSENHKLADDT